MKMPTFANKKEEIDFLVKNKSLLITEKKINSNLKRQDEFITINSNLVSKSIAKETVKEDTEDVLYRDLIINTTNYMDSHSDVHLPKIWNKSLSEKKDRYHVKEHDLSFNGVITYSKDIEAFVKSFTWKELGYNVEGTTEALVYSVAIQKNVNKEMFDLYLKNIIKQHSVRMQYIKIEMAVNDEDYKEEFATWNKYISEIVNSEKAIEQGYFFAVTEAKEIEGSAVLMGSNPITPTIQNKQDNETALIERIKFYEPNFSLKNLNDPIKPQKNDNLILLTI